MTNLHIALPSLPSSCTVELLQEPLFAVLEAREPLLLVLNAADSDIPAKIS
jgi:hypothetical protein